MSRVDQSRLSRSRSSVRRRHLLPAAALLALAGCAGGGLKQGDPFFGGLGTPAPAAGAGTGAAPASTASAGVPPLPGTTSVTSPAALAGGATPAPEGARDLRISSGAPVVPASLPGNGAARGASPGGVQVGEPQPAPESSASRLLPVASAGSPPPAAAPTSSLPPPSATPPGSMTFEQAQQALKQRGVTWQSLVMPSPGQWSFQCSIPNPSKENMSRMYSTETPLPSDPLTAVRAVLDKIEKDQQQ